MGERVLLVEGDNDMHVVHNLLNANKFDMKGVSVVKAPNPDRTNKAAGIDLLMESLPVRLKQSGLKRLGVVVDADTDAKKRWNQLTTRLKQTGETKKFPSKPPHDGFVVDLTTGIRFGAWIMPDNMLRGAIEDFAALLVPPDDPLMPHCDRFIDGIPEENRRFSSDHRSKARIYSWLAVQEEPGRPMGQAITMTYLKHDSATAKPFVDWARRVLFD
jgi:hypothetical protein